MVKASPQPRSSLFLTDFELTFDQLMDFFLNEPLENISQQKGISPNRKFNIKTGEVIN